jgi:hypothetical protein
MSPALRRPPLALVSEHPRRFLAVGAALVIAATVCPAPSWRLTREYPGR